MFHLERLALAAVLLALPAGELRAWTSARVYPSGSGLAYTEDAEGTRIPDFGHAGYHEGCMDPPVVAVIATLTPVAGDNTPNINDAISALASAPLQANGYRGALLLRPGTYNVSGLVLLNVEGVVLRGSGDGTDPASNTIIFSTNTSFDAASNRGEYSVIRAGHSGYAGNGFRTTGASVQITSHWVKVGQASFTVSDVAPFAVGDEVVITHPFSDAFLASIGYGGTETAAPWNTGNGPLIFQRRITAIDPATKTLTVNVGMSHHLKRSLTQCTVAKLDRNRFIKHVGVEDLRVMVTHSSDTDERHAKNAIELNQTFHSHVRNISAKDYWHAAVVVRGSAYATVMDSRGEGFAGIVTGERGYTFSAESHTSNILFKRVWASGGRHNFIASSGFSSHLIVFHDSDSYSAKGGGVMEAHMHWSTGLLLDNVRHNTDQAYVIIGLYSRGDYGTNHGWSCANCVAWNSDVGPRGDIAVQKPPTAQNYAIGCFGDQITGTKPPAPFSQPTGYIEGSKTAGLNPASLYLAQVAARSDCSLPAASPTPSATRTATRTATRSATRTATPSATGTASPSVTRTATPSATRTATPSATPSRSATPTSTRSATESATPTSTATATRSATASVTPTSTTTPTGLLTASATATATATATRSVTASVTPTGTATPTELQTGSATPTSTATATRTATLSVTLTSTATPTELQTGSATPTSTATATRTATPSMTPTSSASPTLLLTASPSPTASPSFRSTPSATALATAAASPSPSPTSSPYAQPQTLGPGGALVLEEAHPVPHPVRGRRLQLRYRSQGAAAFLHLRVYSVAHVLEAQTQVAGPRQGGWEQADWDLGPLAPGLHHLVCQLEDAGRRSPPVKLRLYVLP